MEAAADPPAEFAGADDPASGILWDTLAPCRGSVCDGVKWCRGCDGEDAPADDPGRCVAPEGGPVGDPEADAIGGGDGAALGSVPRSTPGLVLSPARGTCDNSLMEHYFLCCFLQQQKHLCPGRLYHH